MTENETKNAQDEEKKNSLRNIECIGTKING
jgi:hypothetical protein